MPRPDVMAVRTDVVVAHLVDGLFDAAQIRRHRIGDPALGRLKRAGEALDAPTAAVAERLAQQGYAARIAERETFERAREPSPWMEERLREHGGDEAAVQVSLDLARREPLERPAPDDPDAVTWRIPGPGGHVRHLLALRALADEGAAQPALKRAWVFGLVVASCETLDR